MVVLMGAPDIPAVVAANAAIAAANLANQNAQNLAAAAAPGGQPPALQAVPPAAAGQPNVLPYDWVGQLYQWICTNLGQARASGLLTASQNTLFENFKITDVGINRNTLSLGLAALV